MLRSKLKKDVKYCIGIDEVGRGPLAGPVAVCALCLPIKFKDKRFAKFKDSKKLSADQREKWLLLIEEERKKGNIKYAVSFESNTIIDKKGIVFAIKNALKKSINKISSKPNDCLVLLDGGLKAPSEFLKQETIIKGDEKELAIALASIVAKVARDKIMVNLAKTYPQYGFEKHKGYGTAFHGKMICKNGLSKIHRQSFCRAYK